MPDSPRVIAIIQARMGSTRLPGKVLQDIAGATMLERVVSRVGRAATLDATVIATSTLPGDAAIVAACEALGVPAFRGSEDDVLDRYYGAAVAHGADVVVRITSDCPLIEPTVIDMVVDAFLSGRPDYASNVHERSFPRGLDVEAVSMAALELTWREARAEYQRAHVTPYIYQNPERFRLLSVRGDIDYSAYRWTVDTPEDMAFVREVYHRVGGDGLFSWQAVLNLLRREPGLAAINASIEQKELRQG
jgi:spore coat polysaccharide biosynthesis protein SpsF